MRSRSTVGEQRPVTGAAQDVAEVQVAVEQPGVVHRGDGATGGLEHAGGVEEGVVLEGRGGAEVLEQEQDLPLVLPDAPGAGAGDARLAHLLADVELEAGAAGVLRGRWQVLGEQGSAPGTGGGDAAVAAPPQAAAEGFGAVRVEGRIGRPGGVGERQGHGRG
jgi:hypothetical protein